MTAYQKMMGQITMNEDALRERAVQMQEVSAHRTIRQHRTGKHRLLRLTAAAAAVLTFGTVTVGAANNWDYKELFARYFSAKSEQPVEYDFTGMGLDLGDVIEGDGFTLTLDALLADTEAVYLAYHFTLDSKVGAGESLDFPISAVITDADSGTAYSDESGSPAAELGDDGAYHNILTTKLHPGTVLSDKQIQISSMGITSADNPETVQRTYALSGITVQEGYRWDYDSTDEDTFDTVMLTPFRLQFEATGTTQSVGSPYLLHRLPFEEPETLTAVYADGTETAVRLLKDQVGSGSGTGQRGEDGTVTYRITKDYCFAAPVSMDNITAIRISGQEIPVR